MFLLDDPNLGRFTVPYDSSRAPSVSLFCGKNREGSPLTIQFVGRHLSESLLCRMGHMLEQTTDREALRPDIE